MSGKKISPTSGMTKADSFQGIMEEELIQLRLSVPHLLGDSKQR
jgi:hypothetical protein